MAQKGNAATVGVIIAALLLVAGGVYYFAIQKNSTTTSSLNNEVILIPKPTPYDLKADADLKNFTDTKNNFSFQYPSTWTVTTSAGGDSFQIKRDSWKIDVKFTGDFKAGSCGGEGYAYMADYNRFIGQMKPLTVFGQSAYRQMLESGLYWAAGDAPEPFIQPVFFAQPAQKTAAFCYENSAKPVAVEINFVDGSFTVKNLENKAVNKQFLAETDLILSSFKLTN